jgi:hypothetical protein
MAEGGSNGEDGLERETESGATELWATVASLVGEVCVQKEREEERTELRGMMMIRRDRRASVEMGRRKKGTSCGFITLCSAGFAFPTPYFFFPPDFSLALLHFALPFCLVFFLNHFPSEFLLLPLLSVSRYCTLVGETMVLWW